MSFYSYFPSRVTPKSGSKLRQGHKAKIPQPFPYQGSKRNLASAILPYLPKDCQTFWEPFAGSAAMTIAVAAHRLTQRYVINDLHGPLSKLWKNIIENPSGLADRYEMLWKKQLGREKEFFREVRAEFNASGREHDFLFLLARCVKAAVRYNSRGEFNQSADPRRRGMIPATMRGNLLATSALLRGKTEVFALDYVALCQGAKSNDVIYMDPPYQGVCRERDSRYCSPLVYRHFVQALREMNERGLSYLVSYDGRTGEKTHGEPLPNELGLTLIELEAGRSSQATLLGREEVTVESLYLSPCLVQRLNTRADPIAEQPLLV